MRSIDTMLADQHDGELRRHRLEIPYVRLHMTTNFDFMPIAADSI